MYARQFRAAGLSYRVPKIVVRSSGTKAPCGKLTNTYTAHYCPSSQTIYQFLPKASSATREGLTLAKTMAHEIGHHAQQRAGIVPSFNRLYAQARPKTARDYLSHRVEQQAECLAGVFLGAVQESLPVVFEEWDQVVDWAAKHAAPSTARSRNQAFWLERGYDSRSLQASYSTWIGAQRQGGLSLPSRMIRYGSGCLSWGDDRDGPPSRNTRDLSFLLDHTSHVLRTRMARGAGRDRA